MQERPTALELLLGNIASERERCLRYLQETFPEIFNSGPNTLSSILLDPENMLNVAPESERYASDIVRLKGYSNQLETGFTLNFFKYPQGDSRWGLNLRMFSRGEFVIKWEGNENGENGLVRIDFGAASFIFSSSKNTFGIETALGMNHLPLEQGFMQGRIRNLESTHFQTPIKDIASIGNLLSLSFKDSKVLGTGILTLPSTINPTKFE